MRIPMVRALLATALAGALGAAACSSQAVPAQEAAPAAAATTAPVSANVSAKAAVRPAVVRAAAVPAALFGVHPGGSTPAVSAGSWRLWDTGTDWCALQPRSASDWKTAALDAQLARAKAAGVRDVLVVLGCTPRWAQSPANTPAKRAAAKLDGKGYNTSAAPARPADYGRYVARLAAYVHAKYPATAFSFQAWNEANLSTYWRGTPVQMADLTLRVRTAVKKASAGYKVVAASTTLRLTAALKAFYPAYLDALRARGWPVDVFAVHSYPAAEGTPVTRRALVAQARAMLAGRRAPSKPLWDTELNFGLRGPGPGHPFRAKDAATSAAWVSRAYLDSVRLGLGRLYWYQWAPPGPLLGITLWVQSPAATSLSTTAGWLVGATPVGCTATGPLVRCGFRRGGSPFTVMWSEGAAKSVAVPARALRSCTVLGACSAVRPGSSVRVAGSPIYLGS